MTDRLKNERPPFAMIPEWVLDAPISDRAVRLYAVLRRYADEETGRCFPSRRTLGNRLSCSVDSIDRATAELLDLGAVEKEAAYAPSGDRTSNLLTVRWSSRTGADGGREPAATHSDGSGDGSREGAAENENQIEREPSNEPRALVLVQSEETAREEYEEEFDRAWRNYPRKTARKRALRAYQATRRRGVPAASLLGAVEAYARARTGEPQEFTMHGSTFFGPDERWRDYVPAETPASPDAPDLDVLAKRAAAGPRTGSTFTTRQPWEDQ